MSTWIWIAICVMALIVGGVVAILSDSTEDNILKDNNERLLRNALEYHIDMTVDVFDILDVAIEGEKNREIIGV